MKTIGTVQEWGGVGGVLTSHAIVGEPLTELIHNNEEDAERVPEHHLSLQKQELDVSEWWYKKNLCITLITW